MPSSLVVVALVIAWLAVLVPMIVRKRQEVAKTGDSEMGARVLRSGNGEADTGVEPDTFDAELDTFDTEEAAVHEDDAIREDFEEESVAQVTDASEDVPDDDAGQADMSYYEDYPRRYRPGRGGFDPEAAAVIARARYAFRQRIVLAMIIGAVLTAIGATVFYTPLWWAHGAIDLVLVTYLGYLRRQVRIENEIRERRLARMQRVRRAQALARPRYVEDEPRTVEEYVEEAYHDEEEPVAHRERVLDGPSAPVTHRGSAVLVDVDDEDPAFEDLDDPGNLPYRRAVGE
jgi:hypothetical protein